MNKTAIKNFAIWARNKLIADISYRAGLMGITAEGIQKALPQSTGTTEFYDIGTAEPYSISGDAVKQRKHLVELMQRKEKETNYKTAYKYVLEEVAYTWFNRLIAVRFMEVNDYLPSHIRVLSSDSGKMEPDLVTDPFSAGLTFTSEEEQAIYQLKQENKLDEVFRILFIKQCNALNENLPALFEKTSDYTELLLNLSVIDQDGVVYHLVHDIPEEDFDVERGGQVEILGWLYQYYNTEPKDETFSLLKKNIKVVKERIPAATQVFTPDWIVRYMVENSLGRLWLEGHTNDDLKAAWRYYLEESEQKPEVQEKLVKIHKEYAKLNPEDIKVIDPCMGSGHILVYAFDVLMQIYESAGYGQRDAAKSILEKNLYGLDIDDRAFQMAYFAVMMKARQYNRRILSGDYRPNVYSVKESNGIERNHLKYFGVGMSEADKDEAVSQIREILDTFKDAKEYGSVLKVANYNWSLLRSFLQKTDYRGQLTLEIIGLEETKDRILELVEQGEVLSCKYHIAITNPPYLSARGSMNPRLTNYLTKYYPKSKNDLFTVFMDVCGALISPHGFFSMVNQQSWMFLAGFAKLREELYQNFTIENMLQIGAGAFEGIAGEVVQSVAFSIRKMSCQSMYGLYVKMTDGLWKDYAQNGYVPNTYREYMTSIADMNNIPNGILCYWLGGNAIQKYYEGKRLDSYADPRVGMATGDNDQFVRLWQEVDYRNIGIGVSSGEKTLTMNQKWFPYNKGGEYRRWYGNRTHVVDWYHDGKNITAFKQGRLARGEIEKKNSECWNREYYFLESISWSKVSTSRFAVRHFEEGFIFDVAGCSILGLGTNLYYIMGALNSELRNAYIESLSPTMNFETGAIKAFPVIIDESIKNEIEELVKQCISIEKEDWDSHESSWDYRRHPLINGYTTLEEAYNCWEKECLSREQALRNAEERINTLFLNLYELADDYNSAVSPEDVTLFGADKQQDIKSLLSYAVGCMFGRYSLSKDGIVCSGCLPGQEYYERFRPDNDNIIPISDEEYLEDDIISRLCTWLKATYSEKTLEDNLSYIAEALGGKGNSSRDIIRNYFLNDFFKDHCQTYSVTGSGKRPIYWLFDSGKQNGFKALIYLHRYNADTIGNLRIDYLHRMQRIYESEISRMQDMIDHSTSAREIGQATNRRDKLTKQLKECREYDEKLAHLALSRIELDLDDGVKKNYRKIQTANDGKFYEVLADSNNIMSKE